MRKLNVRKEYAVELRQFALTLYFFSSRAYNFVRKSLFNVLPHPATIRQWCCSRPGFSNEVLKRLQKDEELNGEKVVCALMVDEMSKRHQVEYKHDKWYGFVHVQPENPSDETDYSQTPSAKSVFVFMLVGLNKKFKVPMGTFL